MAAGCPHDHEDAPSGILILIPSSARRPSPFRRREAVARLPSSADSECRGRGDGATRASLAGKGAASGKRPLPRAVN